MNKKRPLTILGLIILIVGFVGPAATGIADASSIVRVDTTPPLYQAINPSGTESSPLAMDPGASVNVGAMFRVDDPAEVWVMIDGTRLDLPFIKQPASDLWDYGTTWTAPSTTDTLVKFVFHAKDSVGNEATRTGYLITASMPKGYVTLNGTEITPTSDVTIATKDLTFEFHATSGAADIESVEFVAFYDKSTGQDLFAMPASFDKVTSDLWSYPVITVPHDGAYVIQIWMNAFGRPVIAASIQMGVNDAPVASDPLHEMFFWAKLAGGALLVIGLLIEPRIWGRGGP